MDFMLAILKSKSRYKCRRSCLTSTAHRLDNQLEVEVDVLANGVLRSADLPPKLESIHRVDVLEIGKATQVQVSRNKLVEFLGSLLKGDPPQFLVKLARAGFHLHGVVHIVDGLVVDLQVDLGRRLPDLVKNPACL